MNRFPSELVLRLPDYKRFKRHVWAHVDRDGLPVVFPPPCVYGLHFQGSSDLWIASRVLDVTQRSVGAERAKFVEIEGNRCLLFSDLEALYSFVEALVSASIIDRNAEALARVVLGTLGLGYEEVQHAP